MNRIKMLVYILPRGKGEELSSLAADEGVAFRLVLHGKGTAASDILTLLGIGDVDKDIMLLTVDEERSEYVFRKLGDKMELKRIGGGIGFSIPLSAVANQSIVYDLLAGNLSKVLTERSGK